MYIVDPRVDPGVPFNAQVDWNTAIDNCNALIYAGYDDWRLANLKEMFSIMDFEFNWPAVDVGIFPNMGTDAWWASTSDPAIPAANAKTIQFRGSPAIASWPKIGWFFWAMPCRLGLP